MFGKADKRRLEKITKDTAIDFTIQLIFELSTKYSISIDTVLDTLNKMGYWKVLNDDELCCLLAHDGVNATIKSIGGDFNDILSRDT